MTDSIKIAELWYELIKTQAILQHVIEKAEVKNEEDQILSDKELNDCKQQAIRHVQTRFPKLRLTLK